MHRKNNNNINNTLHLTKDKDEYYAIHRQFDSEQPTPVAVRLKKAFESDW